MILLNVDGLAMFVLLMILQLVQGFQPHVAVLAGINFLLLMHLNAVILPSRQSFELLVAVIAAELLNARVGLLQVIAQRVLEGEPLAADAARELLLVLRRVHNRQVRRQVVFGSERRRAEIAGERPFGSVRVLLQVVVELLLADESFAALSESSR